MGTLSGTNGKNLNWQQILLGALGFWLSATLIIDLVIMPGLYTAGMMTQPGFASAGYSIFWIFNRVETLCAALTLTGLLVLENQHQLSEAKRHTALILSVILLAIALVDTYGLTPQMSAMGLNLTFFETVRLVPSEMMPMQMGYWILELLKVGGCGIILHLCSPWSTANN
ncbi:MULTISPECIES: DUF4149 domain-containing protein [unclassified Roseofilum]|uniref:DUF4149 domain-containing protein n=1 Tax=unclassified Roseofilum TaxID=2620099 RepID=UPI000E919A72|nr:MULTISPECIES: DUF4149 domain-containing protein [unclassified Roseofilum]MBP0007098.1 DUF4149 domain-containing protein [Roseofilum sp. Belize Diploria]MBP0035131.1 DUF4149 domain-containing protein [Roseofilum sp. Belize BBD 4]HBQ99918.1 hypothetical protein [Cyanobacteria bacterium UBA11691]